LNKCLAVSLRKTEKGKANATTWFAFPFAVLIWCRDGVEPSADFLEGGTGHLLGDLAVAQEYKGGPKFDLKGPSERLPFAVLDLDVADARVLLKQSRQLRLERATVRSPLCAEIEKNRARHPVDLLAGRFSFWVSGRYFGCHTLLHFPCHVILLAAYHCVAASSNRTCIRHWRGPSCEFDWLSFC